MGNLPIEIVYFSCGGTNGNPRNTAYPPPPHFCVGVVSREVEIDLVVAESHLPALGKALAEPLAEGGRLGIKIELAGYGVTEGAGLVLQHRDDLVGFERLVVEVVAEGADEHLPFNGFFVHQRQHLLNVAQEPGDPDVLQDAADQLGPFLEPAKAGDLRCGGLAGRVPGADESEDRAGRNCYNL